MSSIPINIHKQTNKENLTHREKERGKERDLTVSPKGKRKRKETKGNKNQQKKRSRRSSLCIEEKNRIEFIFTSLHFIATGITHRIYEIRSFDLISTIKRIPLYEMKLAPQVMKEFEVFRQRDSHHHWYYLLNQNKLNLVLKEKILHRIDRKSNDILRLNGELVQSYDRDVRSSRSDSL